MDQPWAEGSVARTLIKPKLLSHRSTDRDRGGSEPRRMPGSSRRRGAEFLSGHNAERPSGSQSMTHKLVEPGDDARAAERVVALIARYAVRFDPVDRITFYSGDRPQPRSHSGRACSSNARGRHP
jgi:hypothetical protein